MYHLSLSMPLCGNWFWTRWKMTMAITRNRPPSPLVCMRMVYSLQWTTSECTSRRYGTQGESLQNRSTLEVDDYYHWSRHPLLCIHTDYNYTWGIKSFSLQWIYLATTTTKSKTTIEVDIHYYAFTQTTTTLEVSSRSVYSEFTLRLLPLNQRLPLKSTSTTMHSHRLQLHLRYQVVQSTVNLPCDYYH
jgi:hypothetical protein